MNNREETSKSKEELVEELSLLRSRVEELTDFVENAAVGLHWVASDGTIIWANQAELDLLGYTREEYFGRPIAEFHADQNVIGDILARLTRGETLHSYEARLRCKDGSIRYVLITSNVRRRQGEFVHTRCFTRDITERKLTEEALQRSEARYRLLAEASQLLSSSIDYNQTLQNITELIVPSLADWCSIDLADQKVGTRRVATKHVDPSRQELAHSLLERFPFPSSQSHSPTLKKLLNMGQSQFFPQITPEHLKLIARSEEHLEVLRELGLKSGINVPLMVRGQTIGAITLAFSESGREYTQSDLELAEELGRRASQAIDNARLYQEVRNALEERNQFLSIASHELKTPLTSLRGFVQLLNRQLMAGGTLDPARTGEALKVINQQTDKLNRLITQLLDVSRIEAGQLMVEQVPTDLVRLVEGVITSISHSITNNSHTLTLNAPDSLEAMVDPVRFEQVVVNLVDNAIKYSPQGGPVMLALALTENNWVVLSVTDQGLGIPAERRSHIFERFYQAHEHNHIYGMGLGLFISQQIVELHNGHIEVEFPEEGGSRFIVRIPCAG